LTHKIDSYLPHTRPARFHRDSVIWGRRIELVRCTSAPWLIETGLLLVVACRLTDCPCRLASFSQDTGVDRISLQVEASRLSSAFFPFSVFQPSPQSFPKAASLRTIPLQRLVALLRFLAPLLFADG
jgi:hypothetical protein